eukprot:SAG22_NODE_432_length_10559_cov_29.404225_7_plen_211_part_00
MVFASIYNEYQNQLSERLEHVRENRQRSLDKAFTALIGHRRVQRDVGQDAMVAMAAAATAAAAAAVASAAQPGGGEVGSGVLPPTGVPVAGGGGGRRYSGADLLAELDSDEDLGQEQQRRRRRSSATEPLLAVSTFVMLIHEVNKYHSGQTSMAERELDQLVTKLQQQGNVGGKGGACATAQQQPLLPANRLRRRAAPRTPTYSGAAAPT